MFLIWPLAMLRSTLAVSSTVTHVHRLPVGTLRRGILRAAVADNALAAWRSPQMPNGRWPDAAKGQTPAGAEPGLQEAKTQQSVEVRPLVFADVGKLLRPRVVSRVITAHRRAADVHAVRLIKLRAGEELVIPACEVHLAAHPTHKLAAHVARDWLGPHLTLYVVVQRHTQPL